MGMLKTKIKNARRFFRQTACFSSTMSTIPDPFMSFLCVVVTLAYPVILPVSSMSDRLTPPSSTSSAAEVSSLSAENTPAMTALRPTSPVFVANRLKRSSADHRGVHPASIEEDYFGYWNPEPFEGMEGPGPIPHDKGHSLYTERLE